MSLSKILQDSNFNSADFYRAFAVTREEQELRAELLAMLNPMLGKDEILDEVRKR